MFTRPDSIDDPTIVTALRAGWRLDVSGVEYLAAGFGSHHWVAQLADGARRFVTVDDLASRDFLGQHPATAFDGLSQAFTVAQRLHEHGLQWVVGPLPGSDGSLVRWLSADHSIAVFPYVDGTATGEYASAAERQAVVALLAELHASSQSVETLARRETFRLPNRTDLSAALRSLDDQWTGGPYAEPARSLLRQHAAEVKGMLSVYDRLVQQAGQQPQGWTITHGEPHSGNVLRTDLGLRMIDWDTALLAPPERDLWMLLRPGDPDSLAQKYADRAAHSVNADLLRLYALWWDLCEIGIYLAEFRAPHGDTEDLKVSWGGFQHSIEVGGRWPAA